MGKGLYRRWNGSAGAHSVVVRYDAGDQEIPEQLYRADGFKPHFDGLAWSHATASLKIEYLRGGAITHIVKFDGSIDDAARRALDGIKDLDATVARIVDHESGMPLRNVVKRDA